MREELSRRLQRHRDRLVREIDTIGLWTQLYQDGVITRQHVDMCKSMPTYSEMLEVLLDTLEGRDDDCFEKFCRIVRHSNPELVNRCLESDTKEETETGEGDKPGVDSQFRDLRYEALNLEKEDEKLRKKLERLKKMKMWLEKDTENSRIQIRYEKEKVQEEDEKIKKNQQKYRITIFDLECRKARRKDLEKKTEVLKSKSNELNTELDSTRMEVSRLEQELELLTKTNIQLKEDLTGVKKTNADSLDIGHQLPSASTLALLPDQDLQRLDTNQAFVMEACGDLNRRDLIPMLHSLNCITRSQRKSLDNSEDIGLLFNTIRSFSPANYDSFLVCLRRLNQCHIADVLDYGGVAVKLVVGVKLDEDARKKNPIDRLNDIPNRKLINGAFSQCGCQDVRLLTARLPRPAEDRFIEMWVWCTTSTSSKALKVALETGTLLKQMVLIFENLKICQNGIFGKLLLSGRPSSVKTDIGQQLTERCCPCLPYGHIVRKLQKLSSENGHRSTVTGVTSLDDRVYLIHNGSSKIFVFHQKTFLQCDYIAEIPVPGLRNPIDMTAHDGWLYVLERDGECFWKVPLTDGVPPEKCATEVLAKSLSLTPEGDLILTVRSANRSLVICRTLNGQAVREVILPRGFGDAWHGLATTQGEFVVTHRYESICQVSLLKDSGELKSCYKRNPRSSQPALEAPTHMALDEEGQIFVTDYSNQRVLLLDAELQAVRVLLRTETGRPNRLCFNRDTGHLYVGLDNGEIEIYSVNEMKYGD